MKNTTNQIKRSDINAEVYRRVLHEIANEPCRCNPLLNPCSPCMAGTILASTTEDAGETTPLAAADILKMANEGETIPILRALATYADPKNWVQLYDGGAKPVDSDYEPRACEWAFIGPMRPGYELAQNALNGTSNRKKIN